MTPGLHSVNGLRGWHLPELDLLGGRSAVGKGFEGLPLLASSFQARRCLWRLREWVWDRGWFGVRLNATRFDLPPSVLGWPAVLIEVFQGWSVLHVIFDQSKDQVLICVMQDVNSWRAML